MVQDVSALWKESEAKEKEKYSKTVMALVRPNFQNVHVIQTGIYMTEQEGNVGGFRSPNVRNNANNRKSLAAAAAKTANSGDESWDGESEILKLIRRNVCQRSLLPAQAK